MANQHFFKPLLPGFHSHLTIPIAFWKHMDRKYEQNTAELRSDASIKIWKVKVEDGWILTDGWKEFALAHDLRIGDIVVFRQEKDMAFHLTLFGASCCEIQYGSCLDNLGKIQRKKKVKKNLRRETESSSLDPSCFVANVSPSTLRYDTLNLPRWFVRANGLGRRCGEIVLMNENGRSWMLNLKRKNSCGTMYITRGWRSFCRANGIRDGYFFTFKLIQRGKTLILRLSPEESNKEEDCSSQGSEVESLSTEPHSNQDERSSQECSKRKEKKGISICKASSSASQNRFVTVLPIPFTNVNGIKKGKEDESVR
uniref:Putative B3 domain-containing protein REM15 n=1 Tax=Noccaea caerulescens TaxID=107243 RepID=A0A1J3F0F0_NOCCA